MQTNLNVQGVSGSSIAIADKLTPRACEACRARKIRCLQDRLFSDVSCKPCLFANRACVYSDPGLRKRRKRTDARVAELEKTVKALSTALYGGADGDSTIEGNLNTREDFLQASMIMEKLAPKISPVSPMANESYHVDIPSHQWSSSRSCLVAQDEVTSPGMIDNGHTFPHLDVVSRGLLSMTEASFLFDIYVNEMSPHSPDVVLPKGSIVDGVRREQPVLFLAVITAASSTVDGKLNARLTTELRRVFAERVFMKGEKSVELVQALLITTSWSYPSDKYDEAKFYQLIHITATMALEIGLGKKAADSSHSSPPAEHNGSNFTGSRSVWGSWHSPSMGGPALRRDNSEGCRAIVSCYIKCSGVSLGLCRPSMLPFLEWISECVNMLDCSWEAPLTDRRLAAWARLAHVMEEFRTAFASDVSNITVSLVEPRIRHMLRTFSGQLETLRGGLMPDVMDQSLEIYYSYCRIHMHTIAMYSYYGVEEFQPPYLVRIAIEPGRSTNPPVAYIEALSICSIAAQDLINTFLQTEDQVLHPLPTVAYVRMTYAITILLKLSVAATASGGGSGNFIDCESLQLSQYLDKLVSHLSIAAGRNQARVATIFLAIIARLKSWYRKEERVGLCPSCYLIKQDSGCEVLDLSPNGPIAYTTELENVQVTIDPATPVLSTQCIYTPSCSTIYAAKANSQAAPFSLESNDITEQSLEEILATNLASTSQSDDFFNFTLNTDWSQFLPNEGNDLSAEGKHWVPSGMP
ncbi:hypothetical protein MMC17_000818 [Xylographa soralifera]|nr:hypothetical protein [Xylographa soralifera]